MQSPSAFKFDSKIKRNFRFGRKKLKLEKERAKAQEALFMMAGGGNDQRRTLRGFVTPMLQGLAFSIARPNVEAHKFELKTALISVVHDPNLEGPR